MSEPIAADDPPLSALSAPTGQADDLFADELARLPVAARYGVSLLFVAAAIVLAFVVEHLIAPPNLSLLFVLPVVLAATMFGWGPSLATVVASALAFDFFFTEPVYTFQIASPPDLWATGLLLVIAAIVSTVAADSRRRAVEAHRAGEQARALQALAQVVIEARPQAEIVQAAATALQRIFRAPSVIFMERAGSFRPVATAGGPKITSAEEEAARGSLASRLAARSEAYPYDRSAFDFWPVATRSGRGCVVGVDFTGAERGRPSAPERFVEVVAAYLAVALSGAKEAPGAESR